MTGDATGIKYLGRVSGSISQCGDSPPQWRLIPSTMPTVLPMWDTTCDKYEKTLLCTPGFAFCISQVLLPTSCSALPPLVLLWATSHFADEYSPYWWCSEHCMTFGVESTAVKSPVMLLLSCLPLRKLSNLSELKLLLQRRSLMASCLSWILFWIIAECTHI